METPFADSTSMNNRAEDRVQLSTAIADQILNKESFAASAQQHFVEWDKDKSRSLSLTELSDVYNSTTVNYEARATASILSQNFSLFSNLCASHLRDATNRNSYTRTGFQFLESEFGSDQVNNGISVKDLNVLSKLVSENGQQEFVQDAETSEKQNLGLNGLLAGVNGAVSLTYLARLLSPNPVGVLSATVFGINTLAAGVSGAAVFDATRKNDLQLIETQFKQRRAMLNSMEVPRL